MTLVRDLAAILVLVQVGYWFGWRRLAPRVRRWWRKRNAVYDWCEKCNKPLRDRDVWEIRSDATDDALISDVPMMGGGTYMAATYCHDHAPVEAKRRVP